MRNRVPWLILCLFLLAGCTEEVPAVKAQIRESYGENRELKHCCPDTLPAAKCVNGTFVGLRTGKVISFKGIPYAQPPTGNLRWKAPCEALPDDGIYEAYHYGKSPIQTEWPSERGSYYPQGEDCLKLNVWTSQERAWSSQEGACSGPKGAEGKPVMVFFHGGAYGWGATSDPLYDGYNFVSAHPEVVLVTVGYRTGIMGFIDFSSVEGGEQYRESGNLGLLDMVCALKWIRDNIAGFGGNPSNVTIFGESAGAGAVSLLPLMEGAEGLFQRVIAESGSIAFTYSKDECQRLTEMLIEETGAGTMEELLSLSEESLMRVNEKLNDYNNFPERDGIVLPLDLFAAYDSGKAANVEMLIGTNADEVRYWIAEMGYYLPCLDGKMIYSLGIPVMYESDRKKFSSEDKAHLQHFMEMQNEGKVWDISEFYNEILFRAPALYQAQANAGNGGKVYVYYWAHPSAIEDLGACHAVELAYVFNNLDDNIFTGGNPDLRLASMVQEMWVNFAKTGDPSLENLRWEPYSSGHRSTMIIDSECHQENGWMEEQREEIEPLLKYGLNGCYTSLDLNVPIVYEYAAIVLVSILVLALALILAVKNNV